MTFERMDLGGDDLAAGILFAAAVTSGILPDVILGKSRDRIFMKPRQAVYFAIRRRLGWSYPTIGEFMGGRDHSTVVHGEARAEARQAEDPEFAAMLATIMAAPAIEPGSLMARLAATGLRFRTADGCTVLITPPGDALTVCLKTVPDTAAGRAKEAALADLNAKALERKAAARRAMLAGIRNERSVFACNPDVRRMLARAVFDLDEGGYAAIVAEVSG